MKRTIQTYSGNMVDIFDFKKEDFSLDDVAHALSLNNRYNGHTQERYSVARHCINMYMSVLKDLKVGISKEDSYNRSCKLIKALLHDAAEYILPDVPAPYKKHFLIEDQNFNIRKFYDIEHCILRQIYSFLDVSSVFFDEESDDYIKHYDLRMLVVEKKALMSSVKDIEWTSLSGIEEARYFSRDVDLETTKNLYKMLVNQEIQNYVNLCSS